MAKSKNYKKSKRQASSRKAGRPVEKKRYIPKKPSERSKLTFGTRRSGDRITVRFYKKGKKVKFDKRSKSVVGKIFRSGKLVGEFTPAVDNRKKQIKDIDTYILHKIDIALKKKVRHKKPVIEKVYDEELKKYTKESVSKAHEEVRVKPLTEKEIKEIQSVQKIQYEKITYPVNIQYTKKGKDNKLVYEWGQTVNISPKMILETLQLPAELRRKGSNGINDFESKRFKKARVEFRCKFRSHTHDNDELNISVDSNNIQRDIEKSVSAFNEDLRLIMDINFVNWLYFSLSKEAKGWEHTFTPKLKRSYIYTDKQGRRRVRKWNQRLDTINSKMYFTLVLKWQ